MVLAAFEDTRDGYRSRSPPRRGRSEALLPQQAAQTGGQRGRQPSAPPRALDPRSGREALRRNGSFTDAGSPLPSSNGEGGSGRATAGGPLPSARAAAPGGEGARRPAAPLPARCHRRPATAPEPRHFRHGENHFRCAPVCIRAEAGRGGAGPRLPGRGGLAGGHLGSGPRLAVVWLASPKMAGDAHGGGLVSLLVSHIHSSVTAPSRRLFSGSAASCGGGGEARRGQPRSSARRAPASSMLGWTGPCPVAWHSTQLFPRCPLERVCFNCAGTGGEQKLKLLCFDSWRRYPGAMCWEKYQWRLLGCGTVSNNWHICT